MIKMSSLNSSRRTSMIASAAVPDNDRVVILHAPSKALGVEVCAAYYADHSWYSHSSGAQLTLPDGTVWSEMIMSSEQTAATSEV